MTFPRYISDWWSHLFFNHSIMMQACPLCQNWLVASMWIHNLVVPTNRLGALEKEERICADLMDSGLWKIWQRIQYSGFRSLLYCFRVVNSLSKTLSWRLVMCEKCYQSLYPPVYAINGYWRIAFNQDVGQSFIIVYFHAFVDVGVANPALVCAEPSCVVVDLSLRLWFTIAFVAFYERVGRQGYSVVVA